MKTLPTLLTSLILAGWMATTAILAVQNFSPISFRLFGFQSIEIPLGLALSFSAGLGAVGTAIVPFLFGALGAPSEEED